jgi:N-carbamoyl-L-amino-acid hydrolase
VSRDIRVETGLAERLFDELRERTTDAPGITRAAFGAGEEIAHEMMRRTARDLGLEIAVDAAGNLYLTMAGRDPALPAWIVGSHLDSVPHGGNFDGAAGVIAGLSAVSALQAAGIRPRRSIIVMAIRAEESNWFPLSYLGSRAAFGLLPAAALDTPRADTGRALRDHMADLGFRPEEVAADKASSGPIASMAPLDAGFRASLAATASELGIGFIEMASGAGHDTAMFANAGVPVALIFVRNQNGSHNPHDAMRNRGFCGRREPDRQPARAR